jgi:hypothetical protein
MICEREKKKGLRYGAPNQADLVVQTGLNVCFVRLASWWDGWTDGGVNQHGLRRRMTNELHQSNQQEAAGGPRVECDGIRRFNIEEKRE